MPECAFCDHMGPLTLEHKISKWIGKLFPGEKPSFYIGGTPHKERRFPAVAKNWKARVVCGTCNTGWMHKIEDDVKPLLKALIASDIAIPISASAARSLSIFAFKTAVVHNHADMRGKAFFSKRVRSAFRRRHFIPMCANIWICGVKEYMNGVQAMTTYYRSQVGTSQEFLTYVFTCGFGHVVLQVMAVEYAGRIELRSLEGFEDVAIQIWPESSTFIWPVRNTLGPNDFVAFANRWGHVRPIL